MKRLRRLWQRWHRGRPMLTNQEFARDICEAIGMSPGTIRTIDIKLQINDAARVVVEKFLSRDEAMAVAAVVKRYEFILHRKSRPTEVG